MRAQKALSITAIMLSVMTGGLAVSAQETIPETPPELRDFRLDPERAQPQPQPEQIVPPPAVITVPETTQPASPRRAQPQPATETRDPLPVEATRVDPAEPQAGVVVENPAISPVEPERETPPLSATTEEEIAGPGFASWQIASAIALIAALTAFGLMLVRRRPKLDDKPEFVTQATAPEPVPDIAPIWAAKVIEKPLNQPTMTVDFVPEKATISFNALTVRGQLQLINQGDADVTDIELRAGLISASSQQQHAIDAFFSAAKDIVPSVLGEAKAGERLAMSMELSVPLAEMQSFPLGDQRLLVPIMLATLTYRGNADSEPQMTTIARMIGREAKPPQLKMGPLRLDLGPRSFSPLGARSI